MGSYELPRLRKELTGWRLIYRAVLRSTNSFALARRQAGDLPVPAIILTGKQTAGRGRGRNLWYSTEGTITVTFALPVNSILPPWRIPLAAGLAVRRAAALFSREPVELKWPNDLLINGRKLAGLLCERAEQVDLIGVGLNVTTDFRHSPKPVRERAVSLAEVGPGSLSMTTVLIQLAREVRGLLHSADMTDSALIQEYDRYHLLVGRQVTIDRGEEGIVTGRCTGLDHTGRLLLQDGQTTHRIISGQVTSW